MLRSIVFFLVVFSAMLLALWLVVDTDPAPRPEPDETAATDVADDAATETSNTIDFPYWDPEKGRKEFHLRGELPSSVLELGEVKEPTHYVLENGVLEIPIHADLVEVPAPVEEAETFIFTFKRAEYDQLPPERRSERLERIRLSGGGEGRADNGTRIEFEDLEIRIRKGAGYVYTVRSSKPIHISIGHELLEIRSPNGVEGTIRDGKDLERLTFFPPVLTTIDQHRAGAELSARTESAAERGKESTAAPGPATTDGSAAPATLAGGRIAITCEGPLTLDRAATPPRIELAENVVIFPLDTVPADEFPVPGTNRFLCQSVSLLITDEKGKPPAPSEAIARWEGGRVKAFYEGFEVEGDTLRWTGLEIPAESEAILDGRPTLVSPQLRFVADSATFRHAERRIALAGDVRGTVRRQIEAPAEGAAAPAVEPATEQLPEEWAFSADDVDIAFKARTEGREGRSESRGKDARSGSLESVASFHASSQVDDGLVFQSVGESAFEIRGRRVSYDGAIEEAVVDGGQGRSPSFHHGGSTGRARRVLLMLRESALRLDGDVLVQLDEADLRAFRQGVLRESDPEAGDAAADARAETVEATPTSAGALSQIVGLDITADQLDLGFDERRRIVSAAARSLGKSPIAVRPTSQEARYAIFGASLLWDNVATTALMEGGGAGGDPALRPRLEFLGGTLAADRIRFDRTTWKAELEGHVVIRARSSEVSPDGSDPKPLEISCGRAEVEFFAGFEKLGPDDVGSCFAELQSVQRIHAWAPDGGTIEIASAVYAASARQATWDTLPQELRLFGEGKQEFRRFQSGAPDVLRAEEIVYSRGLGTVTLSRQVTGSFVAEGWSGGGSRAPERQPSDASRELLWDYESDGLTARVRESTDCRSLELVSLEARGKVFVACKTEGIKLHGDDFEYDHRQQRIRIFSRDGRYQTLSQEYVPEGEGAAGADVKLNKIDAREIRVWYVREPFASGADARGDAEELRDQIVVKFYEDVTAAFYAPPDLELVPGRRRTAAEEWKLRADYLGLRILPRRVDQRKLQSAYAEGEVIFTAGEMKAMAREAIYEEEESHLILRGSATNKVQLSTGSSTFSDNNFTLSQQGSRFSIKSRGRDPKDAPAIGALRPDVER